MSIKFMYLDKFNTEADEKRLADLAANGEFIQHYVEGIAVFKKGEPKKMRYCIECDMSVPNRQKYDMYKEIGWSFVTGWLGETNIYCTEDENAVPIYTEKSEYVHNVKKFHIVYVILLAAIYFVWGFMGITQIGLSSIITKQSVVALAEEAMYNGDTFSISLIIMGIIICALCSIYFLSQIRAAGQFIAGCAANEKEALKSRRRDNFITALAVIAFIALTFSLVLFVYIKNSSNIEKIEFEDIPSEALMLDEIFPSDKIIQVENEEELAAYFVPDFFKNREYFGSTNAASCTSAVTDKYYEYRIYAAYMPDNEEYGKRVYLRGRYYDFKSDRLAKQAVKELVNWETSFRKKYIVDCKIESLDVSGTPFDEVLFVTAADDVFIVYRKGSTVQAVNTFLFPENGITIETLFENILNSCE